jgi:hypothetical protein
MGAGSSWLNKIGNVRLPDISQLIATPENRQSLKLASPKNLPFSNTGSMRLNPKTWRCQSRRTIAVNTLLSVGKETMLR